MKTPSVSVIIPAYNQAIYLSRAIESALSQTYQDYEIIVVDDGSTDNTPSVACQFANKIRYIRQRNQGLGAARNTGIRASKGEFIGFLDSDDEWMPEFLEKTIFTMTHETNSAVVHSYAQAIDSEGKHLPQIFGRTAISSDNFYQSILRANFLIPSTILLRKSVTDSVGLFEQDNPLMHGCEDWDLWLRILKHYPEYCFIGVPECLVLYRLHDKSLSVDIEKMQTAVGEVINKNFGPDDGLFAQWSKEKRRAYGGVYRYRLITSVQRSGNWSTGPLLAKAFQADPSLAGDIALFYTLALGRQPNGFQGTNKHLELLKNADGIQNLLSYVFNSPNSLQNLRRSAFGSANYALGLLAYNNDKGNLCRKYLLKAIYYQPALLSDFQLIGDLLKSYLNPGWKKELRKFRGNRYKIFTKKNHQLKL